jgi:hypothetical protein
MPALGGALCVGQVPELDKGDALVVVDDVVVGVYASQDGGREKDMEARQLRGMDGDLMAGQGPHRMRLWLDMKPCVPAKAVDGAREAATPPPVLAVDAACVVPPTPTTYVALHLAPRHTRTRHTTR